MILHIADGAPAENWKISPTVWLVAFTAIGNKALAFAALQGAIITWWLRALHGSTIEKLHRDWSHGAGAELWSILRAGRKTGILAITTLATNVILVDGILLQRAINVVQQPAEQLVTLSGPLTTPEVPTNLTGGEIVSPGQGQPWEMPNVLLAGRTAYGPVYRDFVTGTPINATNVGCPGLCQTTLRAPAMMQTECREVLTGRINLTDVMSTETWPPICFVRIGGIVFNNTGMKTCPSLALRTWPTAGNSWEGLTVYYGTTDEGISRKSSGNLTVMTCDFRPAVADYSALLNRNGSIEVDYAKPAFVAWANNTSNFVGRTDVEQEINSTLAGVARTLQVLYDQVSALAIMTQNGETVITYRQPTQFSESLVINGEELDSSQEHLPLYRQPFDKLRAAMNEIVFRTAIHARKSFDDDTLLGWMDPGLTLPSTLNAKRVDLIPKHMINWWFFWGAAILQMICIALVARMYWGFWKLGRSVSFCPLEIAKAFDAPLLRDVPSNMTGEEIAEMMGEKPVRYGDVHDVGLQPDSEIKRRRLLFDDPARVYRPMKRYEFGP